MNWTHFALASYVFILAAILLLIAQRLFQPATSREMASNPLDTAFDQTLLERIARLPQLAEASQNNEARLGMASEPANDLTEPGDEPLELPAWNEAMAPVLRGSAAERLSRERNILEKPFLARTAREKPILEKPSPIRLTRPAASSVARLAVAPERQRTPESLFSRRMEQEAQTAGGEQLDGESDAIRSVRKLIAEGLPDDDIAGRLRLSLAEIGLIRRLPAIAPAPAEATVSTMPSIPTTARPLAAAPTTAPATAPSASPLDAADVPATAKRPRGRPKQDSSASERVRKTQIKENRKTFVNNNRVPAPTTAELPAIAGNRR
jgi:hypothetical protein